MQALRNIVQTSKLSVSALKWQPTPAFLPGESHGQRSLAGYSPWGCKESDTTEPLSKSGIIALSRTFSQMMNSYDVNIHLCLISISGEILLFYETDREGKKWKKEPRLRLFSRETIPTDFYTLLLFSPEVVSKRTPWTVVCQASLSKGFSKQEYWSELLFLPWL